MTDTIGPQFVRAAAGTDPRGWLVFESLPTDLSRGEDATQAADRERNCWRPFERDATPTERLLLENLGYELPEELFTHVHWITTGVRNRRWPQLESQEV